MKILNITHKHTNTHTRTHTHTHTHTHRERERERERKRDGDHVNTRPGFVSCSWEVLVPQYANNTSEVSVRFLLFFVVKRTTLACEQMFIHAYAFALPGVYAVAS